MTITLHLANSIQRYTNIATYKFQANSTRKRSSIITTTYYENKSIISTN